MKKSLILFVHGLDGTSTTTWGSFPQLVRDDAELSAKYDVAMDDYPTRKTGRIFKRIGGLNVAAEGLRTRLTYKHGDYKDIAIIAHSQGGVIVLRYMLDRLLRTEATPLARLLTFATPYAGVTAGGIGAFLGVGSEQTKDLAPESDFLFRLNRDWALFRNQHRVLMKAVLAGCDGVVGAGSGTVLGIPFEFVASGNHQTIVKPDSAGHDSFLIAKRFLLGAPAKPRGTALPKHAIQLPAKTRADLQAAWGKLDERLCQTSNSWLEQWDAPRSHFEDAFAKAAESGLAEAWQAVIEAGSFLREQIRANVEDDFDLPVHYTALAAYTDKVQMALKAAGATPGNALPPEHDELIARIEKLENQVERELDIIEAFRVSRDATQGMQKQADELSKRLAQVDADLSQSKEKSVRAAEKNASEFDPNSVISLIRDALEALKRGVDRLDDWRFTEALRLSARHTWLTGRRYVRAVSNRFLAIRLPWRQEKVFEDFERSEPRFGLPPDIPPTSDISPNAIGSLEGALGESSSLSPTARNGSLDDRPDMVGIARKKAYSLLPIFHDLSTRLKLKGEEGDIDAMYVFNVGSMPGKVKNKIWSEPTHKPHIVKLILGDEGIGDGELLYLLAREVLIHCMRSPKEETDLNSGWAEGFMDRLVFLQVQDWLLHATLTLPDWLHAQPHKALADCTRIHDLRVANLTRNHEIKFARACCDQLNREFLTTPTGVADILLTFGFLLNTSGLREWQRCTLINGLSSVMGTSKQDEALKSIRVACETRDINKLYIDITGRRRH